MKNKEVDRYKKRLDNLFELAKSLPKDELELQAHWSRYLCILVSGFIEVSVREILKEYTRTKAAPNVLINPAS